jgi:hypothetical protein
VSAFRRLRVQRGVGSDHSDFAAFSRTSQLAQPEKGDGVRVQRGWRVSLTRALRFGATVGGMTFADAAAGWAVLSVVIFAVLLVEALTYVFLYRKPGYIRVCKSVEELSRKCKIPSNVG